MPEHAPVAGPSQAVMVEVGPGFGALVVMAPSELAGAEIEISLAETPERRQHVYVLPRSLVGGTACAAVFPRLGAGEHLLWSPDGSPVMTATVRAGRVEEVTWPRSGAPAPRRTLTTNKGD
ncbi:MAG TPA: phospholipase [Candidatus Dormibacteraeota bacterium]